MWTPEGRKVIMKDVNSEVTEKVWNMMPKNFCQRTIWFIIQKRKKLPLRQ